MPKRNKNAKKDDQQAKLPDGFSFRSAPVVLDGTRGVPATLDEENRSVEIICASENPVVEMDYERWERVATILLMSGCQIPANKQVVLLDSHYRYWTETVLGSCRELRIEGDQLIGRAHYSEAEEAESSWTKTKEGHLTDYSVGRVDLEAHYIPDGEKQTIAGREFDGPIKVVTKWVPREMSVCPIGADEEAKARSATPATPNPNRSTKENDMDEKLRKFLESRGLPTTATEDEAYRYLETLEVRSEGGEGTADVAIRAAQQEQTRCIEVRSTCTRAKMPEEKINEFITGGADISEVRKAALDFIVENGETTGGIGHRASIEVGKDGRDKFRSACGDALMIRGGATLEKADPASDDLTGYSMREMAREALRVANQSTRGNTIEMVGRALTASDLPVILGEAANRSLLQGYDQAEETWEQWCDTGSVSDFKTNKIGRMSESDDLDEVREDGEFKYGSRSEHFESYSVATYGKIFPITRQSIINDDMNALVAVPMQHGEAAARKVGDIAYAVLTANTDMGDGNALFHTSHKNLGTTGVVSEATMGELIKLMKLQKNLKSKQRLNIVPKFFIAPVSLEGSAEVFFGSNQFAGDDKSATRANPYAGSRFTRVYEPRLDDDSATAYYVAGAKGKTVRVFFLNGQRRPYLEQRTGWTVDGVEHKVRLDAGAKALDWVGLGRNAGA